MGREISPCVCYPRRINMTLELLAASTMGPPNGLRTDLLCRRPMWRDAICFFYLFIQIVQSFIQAFSIPRRICERLHQGAHTYPYRAYTRHNYGSKSPKKKKTTKKSYRIGVSFFICSIQRTLIRIPPQEKVPLDTTTNGPFSIDPVLDWLFNV